MSKLILKQDISGFSFNSSTNTISFEVGVSLNGISNEETLDTLNLDELVDDLSGLSQNTIISNFYSLSGYRRILAFKFGYNQGITLSDNDGIYTNAIIITDQSNVISVDVTSSDSIDIHTTNSGSDVLVILYGPLTSGFLMENGYFLAESIDSSSSLHKILKEYRYKVTVNFSEGISGEFNNDDFDSTTYSISNETIEILNNVAIDISNGTISSTINDSLVLRDTSNLYVFSGSLSNMYKIDRSNGDVVIVGTSGVTNINIEEGTLSKFSSSTARKAFVNGSTAFIVGGGSIYVMSFSVVDIPDGPIPYPNGDLPPAIQGSASDDTDVFVTILPVVVLSESTGISSSSQLSPADISIVLQNAHNATAGEIIASEGNILAMKSGDTIYITDGTSVHEMSPSGELAVVPTITGYVNKDGEFIENSGGDAEGIPLSNSTAAVIASGSVFVLFLERGPKTISVPAQELADEMTDGDLKTQLSKIRANICVTRALSLSNELVQKIVRLHTDGSSVSAEDISNISNVAEINPRYGCVLAAEGDAQAVKISDTIYVFSNSGEHFSIDASLGAITKLETECLSKIDILRGTTIQGVGITKGIILSTDPSIIALYGKGSSYVVLLEGVEVIPGLIITIQTT